MLLVGFFHGRSLVRMPAVPSRMLGPRWGCLLWILWNRRRRPRSRVVCARVDVHLYHTLISQRSCQRLSASFSGGQPEESCRGSDNFARPICFLPRRCTPIFMGFCYTGLRNSMEFSHDPSYSLLQASYVYVPSTIITLFFFDFLPNSVLSGHFGHS